LNHLHEKALQDLAASGILSFSPTATLQHCEGCSVGKATSGSPPARSDTIVALPGDLIVADLTGPINPISISGYLYILSIIDVCSRYVTVYLLKTKSEASHYLIKFANQFQTKFNRNIKILRTDGGTEFVNNEMNQYCHDHGIVHQQTIRHSSHQNGIAERMFYTLLNAVRAMLHTSGLSKQYWDFAVRYAAITRNLSPSTSTKAIPFTAWHGNPSDYSALRPFGSTCVYLVDKEDRQHHNLDGSTKLVRGQTARLLGFVPNSKGYMLLLPNGTTISARYEQVSFIPPNLNPIDPDLSPSPPSEPPEQSHTTETPVLSIPISSIINTCTDSATHQTPSLSTSPSSSPTNPLVPRPLPSRLPFASSTAPISSLSPSSPDHSDSIEVHPSILPKKTTIIAQPPGSSAPVIYKNRSAGKWKYTLPAPPPKESSTTVDATAILPSTSRRKRNPIDYSSAFPATTTNDTDSSASPSTCSLCLDWFKCPLPTALRSTVPLNPNPTLHPARLIHASI
jgi:hypothetical protein